MTRRILYISLCVLAGGLYLGVLVTAVWALWNFLIPTLFTGGPVLSWWHAAGLLLLVRLLTGGGWHMGKMNKMKHHKDWRQEFRSKVNGLSPEEREQLKEKLRQKWCSKDSGESISNG